MEDDLPIQSTLYLLLKRVDKLENLLQGLIHYINFSPPSSPSSSSYGMIQDEEENGQLIENEEIFVGNLDMEDGGEEEEIEIKHEIFTDDPIMPVASSEEQESDPLILNEEIVESRRNSRKQSFKRNIDKSTGNFLTCPKSRFQPKQDDGSAWKCGKCFKISNTFDTYLFHQVHSCKIPHNYDQQDLEQLGIQWFICKICNKAFNVEGGLTRHVRSHKQLPIHSNSGHINDLRRRRGRFKCSKLGCDSSFRTRQYLANHIKHVHTNKPWVCPVCFKTFPRLNMLEIHQQFHS